MRFWKSRALIAALLSLTTAACTEPAIDVDPGAGAIDAADERDASTIPEDATIDGIDAQVIDVERDAGTRDGGSPTSDAGTDAGTDVPSDAGLEMDSGIDAGRDAQVGRRDAGRDTPDAGPIGRDAQPDPEETVGPFCAPSGDVRPHSTLSCSPSASCGILGSCIGGFCTGTHAFEPGLEMRDMDYDARTLLLERVSGEGARWLVWNERDDATTPLDVGTAIIDAAISGDGDTVYALDADGVMHVLRNGASFAEYEAHTTATECQLRDVSFDGTTALGVCLGTENRNHGVLWDQTEGAHDVGVGEPYWLSDHGTYAVGSQLTNVARWSWRGAPEVLELAFHREAQPLGISASGDRVLGSLHHRPVMWTPCQPRAIDLATTLAPNGQEIEVTAIDPRGRAVAGIIRNGPNAAWRAFRYTPEGGMELSPFLPLGEFIVASVSENAERLPITSLEASPTGDQAGFLWSPRENRLESMAQLSARLGLPEERDGRPVAIARDGHALILRSVSRPLRITRVILP